MLIQNHKNKFKLLDVFSQKYFPLFQFKDFNGCKISTKDVISMFMHKI